MIETQCIDKNVFVTAGVGSRKEQCEYMTARCNYIERQFLDYAAQLRTWLPVLSWENPYADTSIFPGLWADSGIGSRITLYSEKELLEDDSNLSKIIFSILDRK